MNRSPSVGAGAVAEDCDGVFLLLPEAVTALREAKALAPSNPDIAGHLGLAYAKAGHKQEALVELKRALASGRKISNRPELERTVTELSANPSSRSMRSLQAAK